MKSEVIAEDQNFIFSFWVVFIGKVVRWPWVCFLSAPLLLTCCVIMTGSSVDARWLVFYQLVCAPVVKRRMSGTGPRGKKTLELFQALVPITKTLPGFPWHPLINPLTPIWMEDFYTFYTKTTYITVPLWTGFTSPSSKETQCITPHAVSIINPIWAMRIKMLFVVVFMCCSKCNALVITTLVPLLKICGEKKKRPRLVYMHDCCLLWWIGPFKSAAVQSDQSQEFKFVQFPDSTNCSWIAKQRKHWLSVAAVNRSL